MNKSKKKYIKHKKYKKKSKKRNSLLKKTYKKKIFLLRSKKKNKKTHTKRKTKKKIKGGWPCIFGYCLSTPSNNNHHSLHPSNNNRDTSPASDTNLHDHIITTQPGLPTATLINYNSLQEPPIIARQVSSPNEAVPADLDHTPYALNLNRIRSHDFNFDHFDHDENENASLHPDKLYTSYDDYSNREDPDILNNKFLSSAQYFPSDIKNINELFQLYLDDSNSNNISFKKFIDNFILTPVSTPGSTPGSTPQRN